MPAPTSETPGDIYLPETMKHWPLARAFNPHYEEASAASRAWLHGLRPFNPRSQYAFDKGDFGTHMVFYTSTPISNANKGRLAALAYPNASKGIYLSGRRI
jgi:hypothetical protein